MSIFQNLIDVIDIQMNILRIGWIQRKIPKSICESVGEHTLLTTYLTLLISNYFKEYCSEIDFEKVLTMAIIHDLAEVNIGNIAGHIRRKVCNWFEIEINEFKEIAQKINLSTKIIQYFEEYRYGKSIEAKIVILCDKLATLLRAWKYLNQGFNTNDLIKYYSNEVLKILNEISCEKLINFIKLELSKLQIDLNLI